MSTIQIPMEVVQKYLDYFIWEERKSPDCYADVLRLPVFKTVLYAYCQDPDAEIDEEMVEDEIAKAKYIYTTVAKIESLAMKFAKEIRDSETVSLTNFEFFKTQKAVEYMRKDFAELMKKFQRLERRLR